MRRGLGNLQQLLGGRSLFFETDKRCLRPDGSVVRVSLTLAPEWAAGESAHSRIAMVAGISARKQAEEQVQRKFNHLTVDRELRTVEQEKEVNEGCRQACQPPRYTRCSEREQPAPGSLRT